MSIYMPIFLYSIINTKNRKDLSGILFASNQNWMKLQYLLKSTIVLNSQYHYLHFTAPQPPLSDIPNWQTAVATSLRLQRLRITAWFLGGQPLGGLALGGLATMANQGYPSVIKHGQLGNPSPHGIRCTIHSSPHICLAEVPATYNRKSEELQPVKFGLTQLMSPTPNVFSPWFQKYIKNHKSTPL